jgi:hypothetical protein
MRPSEPELEASLGGALGAESSEVSRANSAGVGIQTAVRSLLPSAPVSPVPRPPAASASFFSPANPPLDTRDIPACDSLSHPSFAAAPATAGNHTAASPAPIPPVRLAALHRLAASDTGNSIPPSPSARKPAAGSPDSAHRASTHLPADLRAPPVFCNHRLQHVLVQT